MPSITEGFAVEFGGTLLWMSVRGRADSAGPVRPNPPSWEKQAGPSGLRLRLFSWEKQADPANAKRGESPLKVTLPRDGEGGWVAVSWRSSAAGPVDGEVGGVQHLDARVVLAVERGHGARAAGFLTRRRGS